MLHSLTLLNRDEGIQIKTPNRRANPLPCVEGSFYFCGGASWHRCSMFCTGTGAVDGRKTRTRHLRESELHLESRGASSSTGRFTFEIVGRGYPLRGVGAADLDRYNKGCPG